MEDGHFNFLYSVKAGSSSLLPLTTPTILTKLSFVMLLQQQISRFFTHFLFLKYQKRFIQSK
jgi:hypothetical protein